MSMTPDDVVIMAAIAAYNGNGPRDSAVQLFPESYVQDSHIHGLANGRTSAITAPLIFVSAILISRAARGPPLAIMPCAFVCPPRSSEIGELQLLPRVVLRRTKDRPTAGAAAPEEDPSGPMCA